jgi:hypothetical protein
VNGGAAPPTKNAGERLSSGPAYPSGQINWASGVGRRIACVGRTLPAGSDENRRRCGKRAAKVKKSDRNDGDRRREERAGITVKNAAQRVVCVMGPGTGWRCRSRSPGIAGAVADQTGIEQSRKIVRGRRWKRAKGNKRGEKLKDNGGQRDKPRRPVEAPRAVIAASTKTRHSAGPLLDRQDRG